MLEPRAPATLAAPCSEVVTAARTGVAPGEPRAIASGSAAAAIAKSRAPAATALFPAFRPERSTARPTVPRSRPLAATLCPEPTITAAAKPGAPAFLAALATECATVPSAESAITAGATLAKPGAPTPSLSPLTTVSTGVTPTEPRAIAAESAAGAITRSRAPATAALFAAVRAGRATTLSTVAQSRRPAAILCTEPTFTATAEPGAPAFLAALATGCATAPSIEATITAGAALAKLGPPTLFSPLTAVSIGVTPTEPRAIATESAAAAIAGARSRPLAATLCAEPAITTTSVAAAESGAPAFLAAECATALSTESRITAGAALANPGAPTTFLSPLTTVSAGITPSEPRALTKPATRALTGVALSERPAPAARTPLLSVLALPA